MINFQKFYTEILYSCKDPRDKYTLILKYVEEHKIKSVCEKTEFKPHEVGEGIHLVRVGNDEFVSKQVVNTGYIFDYWQLSKIDRINILEFDVQDSVSDADKLTNTMKELVLKIKKKK
jgi:hypothetical protein